MVETSALRRSDDIKTAVLRSVSHDLRSPLTAIVAAADALASPALGEEDRAELADAIVVESRRLARLVDQLLDLSRLQAGRRRAARGLVLARGGDPRGGRGRGAPVERVRLAIEPDLPLIRADAGQLRRAVANLIENAVRYGGGRPVSVRARVTGGRLLMRVVDQGPGIPPAEQERIFTPFYRAPGAAGRGSGLGLAIVRGLRGGQRRAGAGGVAARARAARSSSSCRCRRRRRSRERRRDGASLVCDDEPQILRALRVMLREAGFEAMPAETAEEALDRAAVRPPDAAIVDLVLPDGDGVEVTRRLREWSAMPIIVLSAVGDEEEKVRALEAGADDYVTKPFGPRELVARLQAALRRADRPAEEPTIASDGLEIDLAARIVRADGEEVHLTPIEFDLLRTLGRERGRLLTHRALLVEVWGPEYANDTAVLRTHIANLRRKIGPQHIRTDPGVGYRFAG